MTKIHCGLTKKELVAAYGYNPNFNLDLPTFISKIVNHQLSDSTAVDLVRLYLKCRPDTNINQPNRRGWTALHKALFPGKNALLCSFLCERGADVHVKNHFNRILMLRAWEESNPLQPACVKALFAAGFPSVKFIENYPRGWSSLRFNFANARRDAWTALFILFERKVLQPRMPEMLQEALFTLVCL